MALVAVLILGWKMYVAPILDAFPDRPSDVVLSQLRSEGDKIVAQIESYKVKNGGYPDNLSDANIVLPKALYGGWRYNILRNSGISFELQIGDYGKDAFTLFYESKDHTWHLDT